MRAFFAMVLLMLTGCGQQGELPMTPAAAQAAEMDVIVSLLQQQYGSSLPAGTPLVIEDTFSISAMLAGESYDKFAQWLLSKASFRVRSDLIRDFCDKNREPQSVWPDLPSRLPIRLLSHAELGSFFSAQTEEKGDSWKLFYAKYPKSPGIITLSRVGFNRRGTMAMVYLGSQSDWKAGSGTIHIFQKQGGKWVEKDVWWMWES